MDWDSSDFIAIVALLCVFALPLCTWVIFRVLEHRERMEMIRHGQMPPLPLARAARYGYGYGYDPDAYASIQLRRGISVTFIGIALFAGLAFIGYTAYDPGEIFGHFIPGPWLLGGLIPMVVGIAQIIGALLGGARFRAAPRSAGFGPPSYGEDAGSASTQESESSKRPPV